MGRKIFISVLGTSFYEKCRYFSGDFVSEETSFIQHAALQFHIANEWSAESKAFILLTEKAKTANWSLPTGHRYNNNLKEEIPYKGLEEVLTDMHLPFSIEPIAIPDGKNEGEMWQIFEKVFNLLEEGDELYFDLTHSFRYLPMLMLVLCNYTKFLKKATICSITYGNFEARDEISNEAPIVDLLPLSSLQDWTFATADFLKNGYADRLIGLSQKGLAPLLRSGDENVNKIKKLIKHLESFTTEMRICRGMDVIGSQSAENIRADINGLHTVVIPQLEPVLQELSKSIEPFSASGNVLNMFKAAQWCFNNQLYQQSTTFLEEGIISYFCKKYGIKLDNRKKRELITSAFNIIASRIPEEEWRVSNPDWIGHLRKIVDDIKEHHGNLINSFNSIVAIRNDYNHCGMREERMPPGNIKKKIKSRLDNLVPMLGPIGSNILFESDNTKCLFINLSNHPSSQWEEKQINAALQFGEIIDLQFPQVEPNDNNQQIDLLADEYVLKIENMAKGAFVTVHIMGELTFVYAIVSKLKQSGIECYASTSERNVVENNNGLKTSIFKFVNFRRY